MGPTAGDVDREYLTATGMFLALDESRTVADITAELRWPERILNMHRLNYKCKEES